MPVPAGTGGATGVVSRKIGPLPLWAWVVTGAGIGFLLLRRGKATVTPVASPQGAAPTTNQDPMQASDAESLIQAINNLNAGLTAHHIVNGNTDPSSSTLGPQQEVGGHLPWDAWQPGGPFTQGAPQAWQIPSGSPLTQQQIAVVQWLQSQGMKPPPNTWVNAAWQPFTAAQIQKAQALGYSPSVVQSFLPLVQQSSGPTGGPSAGGVGITGPSANIHTQVGSRVAIAGAGPRHGGQEMGSAALYVRPRQNFISPWPNNPVNMGGSTFLSLAGHPRFPRDSFDVQPHDEILGTMSQAARTVISHENPTVGGEGGVGGSIRGMIGTLKYMPSHPFRQPSVGVPPQTNWLLSKTVQQFLGWGIRRKTLRKATTAAPFKAQDAVHRQIASYVSRPPMPGAARRRQY